jgi:nuclear pore complex protein Nup155
MCSTTGVLELERRRPVDVLCAMLEERSTDKMEQFFKSYGAGESAAMCLMLIIAPIGQVSTVRAPLNPRHTLYAPN